MYLEIDEGFPKHRKTLRLRSIMKDPRAGWYMVDLWTWACRSCPDGNLTGISSYEIEEAANYQACDGKLCKAMIDSGFIDTDADGNPIGLHNWMARTGAAIARMAKRASDMKALREQRKRDRDGTVAAQLQHGDATNPTRQDKTSQDQSRQDKTSPGNPPARDPDTTDTDVQVQPDPLDDGPLLPTTPSRLVNCIKAAVEKARPERGFWDPGAKASFVLQDASEFLGGLGDIDFAAPEVLRRIQLFAKDDRMNPWTFAKFRREYNGIGVARPAPFQQAQRPQAKY